MIEVALGKACHGSASFIDHVLEYAKYLVYAHCDVDKVATLALHIYAVIEIAVQGMLDCCVDSAFKLDFVCFIFPFDDSAKPAALLVDDRIGSHDESSATEFQLDPVGGISGV